MPWMDRSLLSNWFRLLGFYSSRISNSASSDQDDSGSSYLAGDTTVDDKLRSRNVLGFIGG